MDVQHAFVPAGPTAAPISQELAEFAARFAYEAIPAPVRVRAKHLALDAVGIALASTQFEFAHRTFSALIDLGGTGTSVVLGLSSRLPLRDAVMMNALLVHGLDYDDTHVPGIVHTSASGVPLALGLAAHLDRSGRELLAAYVLAVEMSARLGSVAKGEFHQTGFHPTGLIGTFGCTLAAGFLYGMNAAQLKMAQGIALSLTSGSLEFLQDGAWTKRIHPGWAGVAGITAASLARRGFIGPGAAYEGRFGLFPSYLGAQANKCDYSLATRSLGKVWEVENIAVKPYPACHFVHACTDAAIALRAKGVRADDIAHVRALVPQGVVKTVCEPVANKRRPANGYDAKFSIPYAIAMGFVRGRFGLAELEEAALHDAQVLTLADKVDYDADPNSGFPKWYSGEVIVQLKDGREFSHREQVNRGAADRPLLNEEIIAKFMDNAQLAVSATRAEELRDAVLAMDEKSVSARDLESVLGA
jgi:2-methylcitrate dehydratase PrpD